MSEPAVDASRATNVDHYGVLLDIVRHRMTNRAFAPYDVPREHFELMSDADIDRWIKTTRHKVMYRDEAKID